MRKVAIYSVVELDKTGLSWLETTSVADVDLFGHPRFRADDRSVELLPLSTCWVIAVRHIEQHSIVVYMILEVGIQSIDRPSFPGAHYDTEV